MILKQPGYNKPFFPEVSCGGFQEVWYLKLNAPEEVRALWLRFTLLINAAGEKQVAEVWAIFFDRSSGEPVKVGLKNTSPLSSFHFDTGGTLRIGDSLLSDTATAGALEKDGSCIAWEFHIQSDPTEGTHDFVPALLRRARLVKNTVWTVHENQYYTGWCEVNGNRVSWENAPGMQGHLAGPKNGYSWAWGHCNCFRDEAGNPAPVVWDGLAARTRVGPWIAPPLTSMYFQLGKQQFSCNTLRDALHCRSSHDSSGWHFQIRKGGYRFEGRLAVAKDDFAGVVYEDTDGSLLYCHNTKIGDMTLEVEFPDRQRKIYTARNSAAYESVRRQPDSAVAFVI